MLHPHTDTSHTQGAEKSLQYNSIYYMFWHNFNNGLLLQRSHCISTIMGIFALFQNICILYNIEEKTK